MNLLLVSNDFPKIEQTPTAYQAMLDEADVIVVNRRKQLGTSGLTKEYWQVEKSGYLSPVTISLQTLSDMTKISSVSRVNFDLVKDFI